MIVEKSKLYTGGGDTGMTSLVGGERVRKDCVRLEAYGTVDEFSASLGVVATHVPHGGDIENQLLKVQNRLFDIGGYLASRPGGNGIDAVSGMSDSCIELEKWIDTLDSSIPKIQAFVLPGGCAAAAFAHVARTVCRRAERRLFALSLIEDVDPDVCRYFNRLSDYLFILARYLNHSEGVEEIVWRQEF